MNKLNGKELAVLLLRLSLGTVLISHSLYLKLMVFTLAGTAQFFNSLGLPEFSAYLVFAIEAAAGIALFIGYQGRWVALASLPILLGASWVHWGNGWLFTNPGGGWEYPLFLTIQAGAVALLDEGKLSLLGLLRGEKKEALAHD